MHPIRTPLAVLGLAALLLVVLPTTTAETACCENLDGAALPSAVRPLPAPAPSLRERLEAEVLRWTDDVRSTRLGFRWLRAEQEPLVSCWTCRANAELPVDDVTGRLALEPPAGERKLRVRF